MKTVTTDLLRLHNDNMEMMIINVTNQDEAKEDIESNLANFRYKGLIRVSILNQNYAKNCIYIPVLASRFLFASRLDESKYIDLL